MLNFRLLSLCLILVVSPCGFVEVEAQRFSGAAGQIYKTRINPSWIGEGDQFWYRNDLHGGQREFVLVDATTGQRSLAFDHEKLAIALTKAGVKSEAKKLPIQKLSFDLAAKRASFSVDGNTWNLDLGTSELTKALATDADSIQGLKPLSDIPTQFPTGGETSITFVNQTNQTVEIFWARRGGDRVSYATLTPDQVHTQHTYAGHVWQVIGAQGKLIAIFQATVAEDKAIIRLTQNKNPRPSVGNRQRRGRGVQRSSSKPISPDGKWRAEVHGENVSIVNIKTDKKIQLSTDGTKGNSYGRLSWSPDSKSLAAFRIEVVAAKKVFRVNSAIGKDSFRGELQEQGYPLPGDEFTKYEPNVFDISNQKQIKPEVERVDFGSPRFYWHGDHKATYQKVDRGHQRFRMVEIDGLTGTARNIIDERTDTFIWTTHMGTMRFQRVKWLKGNKEIIYVSEMDGHRHLFLIDVVSGTIKNKMTPGEYVVSEVDQIDEDNRKVWFRATGMNKEQDPYFTHYYRINFDGSDLIELTKGNGTHGIVYSPHRKYFIDSYSRVDMPPVHELRQTSDGKLVCKLDTADVAHSDWKPTTVFVSKGRDNKTDIWGLIAFPENIDPDKKYPIDPLP